MFNGAGMFGCGGATSSTFGFGVGKGTGTSTTGASNLPKALQIAANRAKMSAPMLNSNVASPASPGTIPSLSEVDMDSMASMMNMAAMALAAGNSDAPKIPMPLPVGKAAPKSPSAFVPPGRVVKEKDTPEPQKEELPTSTDVKVSDLEGDRQLSLDEMVKRVGEKVNMAGGLTAIGYGAAKGKPYVRGRPKANSVIADDYREGPYTAPAMPGKGKGNDAKAGTEMDMSRRFRGGLMIGKIFEHLSPFDFTSRDLRG